MIKKLCISFVAVLLAVGCTKDLKNDISDLKKRVSSLEEITASLKKQLDSGALISSVTPLEDGTGYRIEFTGGSSRVGSSIDILHGDDGNHGVTPMIEVRKNADGTRTIWYKTDGDWIDTGVDLTGSGGTGSPGKNGLTPELGVWKNEDNVITLHYRFGGGDTPWIDTGVDLTGPAGDSYINSITDLGDGTVCIMLNDAEDYEDMTKYIFEKASPTLRFEIMTTPGNIVENMTGKVKFVVNPSTAWIPTTGDGDMNKWRINAIETTRADYVNVSNFSIVSIVPDENASGEILEGQYIATIECEAVDPLATEYVVALVLNGGSKDKPSLVSSSPFTLGAMARTPQNYPVGNWADLQGAIDLALDRDIIDISGIDHQVIPDTPTVVTISKDITITAQMDPVLGQFGDGTPYSAFYNAYFVLDGNPTVTFDKVSFSSDYMKPALQPFISGTGNVIVRDASMFHEAPIDIDGDVWVYGTIAKLPGGNINHTTEIGATQSDDNAVTPNPGIRARNVTIEGGSVAGGSAFGSAFGGGDPLFGTSKGGAGIEASGDVTITGVYTLFPDDGRGFDYYMESAVVFGGDGHDNAGGDAIVAAGRVTITGGVFVCGGNSLGNSMGWGGSGIVADGDVTLSGTRELVDGNWWFSCNVRSGWGDYCPGIPFKFSGDATSPTRTLTATTASITGQNYRTTLTPPDGGYAAPYTMELQADDHAIFDDCRIGWYPNIPLFSANGGHYKFISEFNTWGNFDNGTVLP